MLSRLSRLTRRSVRVRCVFSVGVGVVLPVPVSVSRGIIVSKGVLHFESGSIILVSSAVYSGCRCRCRCGMGWDIRHSDRGQLDQWSRWIGTSGPLCCAGGTSARTRRHSVASRRWRGAVDIRRAGGRRATRFAGLVHGALLAGDGRRDLVVGFNQSEKGLLVWRWVCRMNKGLNDPRGSPAAVDKLLDQVVVVHLSLRSGLDKLQEQLRRVLRLRDAGCQLTRLRQYIRGLGPIGVWW